MAMLARVAGCWWLLCCCCCDGGLPLAAAAGGAPTVETILKRVAEAQERSVEARSRVVYTQFVHAKLMRSNGKLAREEKRTYTVTPSPKGFERKLDKFEGWYESKGRIVSFSDIEFEHKGLDIDKELMGELIDDWTGSGGSRDGIDRDLFPLAAEHQEKYDFQMAGAVRLGPQERIRVTYQPRPKSGAAWRGDFFVDPASLEPTAMNSTFAYRIPRAVKILFGISLRQVGFSVNYSEAIDGVWLPVSAGTEFSLRVLFGYARTLTISLRNYDFRRATAESTIRFDQPDRLAVQENVKP